MIRVAIIDDEKLARDRLMGFLRNASDVEVVAQADNGVDAVSVIQTEHPDVAFLDVQMPGLDGFGVVKALSQPPLIVFATAYDEYAIRAFEVHAADYLLKPISRQRLEETLRRVRERISGQAPAVELRALLERIEQHSRRYLDLIPVQRGRHIVVVPAEQVLWFEVEHRLVYAHIEGDRFMTNFTLKDLEEQLNPACFFRAHKSRLVNLKQVKSIVPSFGGRHKLVMRDQSSSEVELSRAQGRELRDRMRW